MQNYPSPEPQSHPVSYPSGQPPQPGQYAAPPMQQMKPKKKRGRGCLIGGIVTAALLVIIVIAALNTPTSPQAASPSPTAAVQPTQHTTTPARPTTAPTRQPTLKPTTAPQSGIVATHGTPRMGGPISDYYGAYGKPSNQGNGNSQTWITKEQYFINATPDDKQMVTATSVIGPDNWTRQQTETYCGKFLPADAAEFNRLKDTINTLIDYHTSAGEVVMTVMDGGGCLLNFGQN